MRGVLRSLRCLTSKGAAQSLQRWAAARGRDKLGWFPGQKGFLAFCRLASMFRGSVSGLRRCQRQAGDPTSLTVSSRTFLFKD